MSRCAQDIVAAHGRAMRVPFDEHFWIIDEERLVQQLDGPVVLRRTWRCLRCGASWRVEGEPSREYLAAAA